MNVPYSWLRELVPALPADPADLVWRLSQSGTYVEAVHEVGVDVVDGDAGAFRIGHVLGFERHPDADKLRLVQVDVGEGGPRQIVCGASNFEQGDAVAVVLPGGTLPGGMKIREAKLRGVESRGMMLSERELDLSTEHAGIMRLPREWQPGDLLHEHVPIGDHVLELEVTGNRPDCLGMLGIALEAAAAMGVDMPDAAPVEPDAAATGDVHDHVSVTLEAPDLCPRYMARAFVDVQVGPSPLWLKARLTRAGMRSINNVVDITNYVMLLTGQPLHAFDGERLRGNSIVVRRAREDEQVTTLDDVERTLGPDTLVIADAQQVAVIAGVMGAADVEVGESTTRIVLEAACFDGHVIQRTSRELGLRSESSSRFEKGLDPHAPERALAYASAMLVELCSARMVPGTIDACAPGQPVAPPVIDMPLELPSTVLGLDVSIDEAMASLGALGFGTEHVDGALRVQVPHWRMRDVTRPIDLVEELGRFRLDEIPSRVPAVRSGGARLDGAQRLRRAVEDVCAGSGLHEVVTYGLVPAGAGVAYGNDPEDVLRLSNPMIVDHAELRTGMLEGHLEVVRRNVHAGANSCGLFEVGRTFHAIDDGAVGADGLPRFASERDVLAMIVTGELFGGRWDQPGVAADLPALSGIVASAVAAAGAEARLVRMPNPPAWLHPGQAAQLHADPDGAVVGWVGAVHPGWAAARGIEQDCFAAHVDLAALAAASTRRALFTAYSEYPPIVEDIAMVLDDAVSGGEVVATARAAGGELLESVSVFDRYVGEPIPADHHSLALRLVFRAMDRTLTDAETAEVRGHIVDQLATAHHAVLRG